MRREICRISAALALLVSVSWSFAASLPAKPEAASADPGPISDALCGRGKGARANLANALDESGPIALPLIWRDVEVEKLQPWLEAPICSGASESESNLYRSRRRVLDGLGRRLERAEVTEQIGSSVARFRGWRPNPQEWPSSFECDRCAALRSSAARVVDIASRWPPRTSTKLGGWLGEAANREPLVAELCAAQPSPGAQEEIEKKFRYYSWTAGGTRLFEVAALFEEPDVVAGCRGR
jgi:hypothetical protein